MTLADNTFEWKYTVPMEKSLRDGNRWIIRGVAAGVERDKQGDIITPAAIQQLAMQINEAPVPFRNQHQSESITEDIGYLIKAYVSPDFQLEVEVELDQDNPDAQYLWKKLDQGKKYGMSIKGSSVKPYTAIDSKTGMMARYHPNVIVGEVSATTRPVYSHSLGTVLKKAFETATGDNDMTAPITGDTQTVSETAAPANVSTTETLTPSQELVKSLMADDGFKSFMTATISEAVGGSKDSVEDTTVVTKSETDAEEVPTPAPVDVAELVKSLTAELNKTTDEKFEALLSRLADRGPAVLIKSEVETADETIASLRTDPRRAIRLALAAKHNELGKF